jgi:hypothetical protein
MPFPPRREHKIPLAAAIAMTRRYRQGTGKDAVRAGMFPRNAFEAILNQAGCHGIRIYYGRADDGQLSLVMVGVDAEGNDIHEGELMEDGFPCPPFCDDGTSPLNA